MTTAAKKLKELLQTGKVSYGDLSIYSIGHKPLSHNEIMSQYKILETANRMYQNFKSVGYSDQPSFANQEFDKQIYAVLKNSPFLAQHPDITESMIQDELAVNHGYEKVAAQAAMGAVGYFVSSLLPGKRIQKLAKYASAAACADAAKKFATTENRATRYAKNKMDIEGVEHSLGKVVEAFYEAHALHLENIAGNEETNINTLDVDLDQEIRKGKNLNQKQELNIEKKMIHAKGFKDAFTYKEIFEGYKVLAELRPYIERDIQNKAYSKTCSPEQKSRDKQFIKFLKERNLDERLIQFLISNLAEDAGVFDKIIGSLENAFGTKSGIPKMSSPLGARIITLCDKLEQFLLNPYKEVDDLYDFEIPKFTAAKGKKGQYDLQVATFNTHMQNMLSEKIREEKNKALTAENLKDKEKAIEAYLNYKFQLQKINGMAEGFNFEKERGELLCSELELSVDEIFEELQKLDTFFLNTIKDLQNKIEEFGDVAEEGYTEAQLDQLVEQLTKESKEKQKEISEKFEKFKSLIEQAKSKVVSEEEQEKLSILQDKSGFYENIFQKANILAQEAGSAKEDMTVEELLSQYKDLLENFEPFVKGFIEVQQNIQNRIETTPMLKTLPEAAKQQAYISEMKKALNDEEALIKTYESLKPKYDVLYKYYQELESKITDGNFKQSIQEHNDLFNHFEELCKAAGITLNIKEESPDVKEKEAEKSEAKKAELSGELEPLAVKLREALKEDDLGVIAYKELYEVYKKFEEKLKEYEKSSEEGDETLEEYQQLSSDVHGKFLEIFSSIEKGDFDKKYEEKIKAEKSKSEASKKVKLSEITEKDNLLRELFKKEKILLQGVELYVVDEHRFSGDGKFLTNRIFTHADNKLNAAIVNKKGEAVFLVRGKLQKNDKGQVIRATGIELKGIKGDGKIKDSVYSRDVLEDAIEKSGIESLKIIEKSLLTPIVSGQFVTEQITKLEEALFEHSAIEKRKIKKGIGRLVSIIDATVQDYQEKYKASDIGENTEFFNSSSDLKWKIFATYDGNCLIKSKDLAKLVALMKKQEMDVKKVLEIEAKLQGIEAIYKEEFEKHISVPSSIRAFFEGIEPKKEKSTIRMQGKKSCHL